MTGSHQYEIQKKDVNNGNQTSKENAVRMTVVTTKNQYYFLAQSCEYNCEYSFGDNSTQTLDEGLELAYVEFS